MELGDLFEQHRPRLHAVAYRMLGSDAEADDAVQEAWLRLARTEAETVENLGGWLTTVVGRVCLDMLRTRRMRSEQPLPEPFVVLADDDPERDAVVADSVGLALLVLLDSLTPPERLAYVLHDLFAVPFEEIAEIVDRSPAAARQLASRARRRVRGLTPPDADVGIQREVVDAFLAASRAGDFEALLAVLDPDVVFRVDGEGVAAGAEMVARRVLARGSRLAPHARPAIVNGRAGAAVVLPGGFASVVDFRVADGRVVAIDVFTRARLA